jgi:hypothetical protein
MDVSVVSLSHLVSLYHKDYRHIHRIHHKSIPIPPETTLYHSTIPVPVQMCFRQLILDRPIIHGVAWTVPSSSPRFRTKVKKSKFKFHSVIAPSGSSTRIHGESMDRHRCTRTHNHPSTYIGPYHTATHPSTSSTRKF